MEDLKSRFFRHWQEDNEWFKQGLLIASAKDEVVLSALPKFDTSFAGIAWDVLGRKSYGYHFRTPILIKSALGGCRLIWKCRNQFDLVIICWPKDARLRDLRLQAWLAFLAMRPKRFFILAEEGSGFWLSIDDEQVVRYRFPRLARIWDLLSVGEANIFYRLWKVLLRLFRLVAGTLLLLGATVLLVFWRCFYDTYDFRYRFLGKVIGPEPRAVRRAIEAEAETPD